MCLSGHIVSIVSTTAIKCFSRNTKDIFDLLIIRFSYTSFLNHIFLLS